MGGSAWSDDHYHARASYKSARGEKTFEHDHKIKSGRIAAEAHELLDPKKLKNGIREARDSEANPASKPVFIGLDVTGSMMTVPKQIQKKLPLVMGLLQRKGYLEDPAVCVSAIGDVKFDRVPFQVSQFEAGVEIDEAISELFLEGGGGGNRIESYEIALHFLAERVEFDAWDKRKEKGYAFIICDENLATTLYGSEVAKVFGGQPSEDMPIKQLMDKVHERWEVYCIVPDMTCHYSNPDMRTVWRNHLGERVIMLDNPDGIAELIATTVGVLEDATSLDSVVNDLTSEGVDANVTESVSRALSTVRSTSVMKTDGTGLATLD